VPPGDTVNGKRVFGSDYPWGDSDIIIANVATAAMLEVYCVAAVQRRRKLRTTRLSVNQ